MEQMIFVTILTNKLHSVFPKIYLNLSIKTKSKSIYKNMIHLRFEKLSDKYTS